MQKLKKAKDIKEVNLEDIKALIPNSNWDKYFSENVNISKEQLSKQWDELYDLRCRIAHNRAFAKSDFESVERLCNELRTVIKSAIDNLDKIDISDNEREMLTESIAGNFNQLSGEFMSLWRELQRTVIDIIKSKKLLEDSERPMKGRTWLGDINLLHKEGVIEKELYFRIRRLTNVRNEVVHNTDTLTQEEILNFINEAKTIIKSLKTWE